MKDKRYVDLHGTFNFRDIGGYETKDGGHVVFGKLYRSDDLHELDAHDVETLTSLGLRTIIDYRNAAERSKREDVFIPHTQIYYLDPKADAAAMASSSFQGDEQAAMKELTAKKARYMMVEQNRQFVLADSSKQAYRKMFDILLDPKNGAIVQHCRGGKDRTGFGIALILLCLGVSITDVVQDYMLTNYYKHDKNEASLQAIMEKTKNADLVQSLRYLKEANEAFIMTAIEEIEHRYHDVETYLKEALHLQEEEIKTLKQLYVEY